jgi:hypothetical protein
VGSPKTEDPKYAPLLDRVKVEPDHRFVGFEAYKKVLASDIDIVMLATPPGYRPMHRGGGGGKEQAPVQTPHRVAEAESTSKPFFHDTSGFKRHLKARTVRTIS